MTALLLCWVASPLVLALLAYGCGAVVELAAGRKLALGVLLPCGTALVICVLDLATRTTATVGVAVPAVVVLAVVGLALRARALTPQARDARAQPSPERTNGFRGPIVVGVVVFAVYAAPIVLSGMATWAGYVKLDDTATWLALVDRTLTAGHTLSGLGASTYRDTLAAYLLGGYPVGSFLPLGLGHKLLGEDIAWLVDPWMAFMAAMLALSLERIAAHALGERAPRWQPDAIAIFAAQPALLYGYYLWGGMKEMAGAMLIAAFATTMPLAFEGKRRARALIPPLVVVLAMLAALSAGGLVWLVPGSALALVALSARRGVRLPSLRTTLAMLAACALAGYLALRPGGFVEQNKNVLTGGDELGNLLAPLHLRQIVGIWPAGDFRMAPDSPIVADVLIALAVVLGIGGLIMAVRRARRELTLYLLCALAGALLVFWIASPWLGGKALASASPAVALVALVACVMLLASDHQPPRILGAVAGIAIVVGIVWSNVLGYHDVSLAPRAQYAELAEIGDRIAGQGPTLMTEFSPFGARHFLRAAEPESASELRSRLDPLSSGEPLAKGTTADIDQFQLPAVLAYRTLVLRRSPTESRPPSPFKLILRDHFWEVWQRPAYVHPPVLAQLPLGNAVQSGGVPSCTAVSSLARTPGASQLLAVPAVNPIAVSIGEGSHPRRWSNSAELLTLAGAGVARVRVTVAHAGRYSVWLGGSINPPVTIDINGVEIGTVRYETQEDAQYVLFGAIGLERGTYVVSIAYHGGDWRPGSGGPPAIVGPLLLQREVPEQQPITVPVAAARSLCGRTLEWIEALGV
jgi:hypothetical protein